MILRRSRGNGKAKLRNTILAGFLPSSSTVTFSLFRRPPKMMFPGMLREAPKEPLSPKWRLVLRVVGFVGVCVLIAKCADLADMPENNRLA
ncbi:putative transmembrane protein [Toxoplasma gondii TgCatPRC2]|uniref:Transmembrane protein n=16 Tax=Toxoplasma gondii TaxID=5811 RepID=A0A125YJC6_TOXGV|nr:hypothetical protein TGME49_277920 [Toxoplasma gondii ME49]EPR63238.1 hypothetical protein TGGT1_277920 [Toxoplasma gondii GT1]ESS28095.1 putative transmembrane protein [Toxoplasma gondii VEG]KAF4638975.1 hypothetical protein TGRH88_065840 [Toxoplasma gondii]KFG32234.1 putative transmembrane protein [Toxoplasma gondii p89]KFG34371.1 putative transmembrane protein [Toxoplasma gondii GAB2-2007-GAL-DOM2]KFG45845.1 putative transmembrane protein [Toxoplasma gondii FOU]KFG58621.1 putative tran|eukprot:XP_002370497.1 hypothetical protein TGME49_277920 [Toxoplasma gondii ME49]